MADSVRAGDVVSQQLLTCVLCVPQEWTDKQAETYADWWVPSDMPWQVVPDSSFPCTCGKRKYHHIQMEVT